MKFNKKMVTVFMAVLMAVCLAVPAFAAPINTDGDFADYIFGWEGQDAALLKGHGVNQTITVGTQNSAPGDDVWRPVRMGNNYVIYNGMPGSYCVNIRRVLINGAYYYCTGYPYDDSTEGRDQLVKISNFGNYSIVRLADPLISGIWYMNADFSNPVERSDVVWYIDHSKQKARWTS